MELTVPTRLQVQEALASPGMLVEPSTTIYLDDDMNREKVRQIVSEACYHEHILSFRLDGEIVDVVEELRAHME